MHDTTTTASNTAIRTSRIAGQQCSPRPATAHAGGGSIAARAEAPEREEYLDRDEHDERQRTDHPDDR